jgi:hypothetical protein
LHPIQLGLKKSSSIGLFSALARAKTTSIFVSHIIVFAMIVPHLSQYSNKGHKKINGVKTVLFE